MEQRKHLNINTNISFQSASVTGTPSVNQTSRSFIPHANIDPKRISKVLMHFTGVVNVVLGSVLDTFETYMVDAELSVRQNGLYKRETKFRFKLARQKFDRLKSVLYANIKGREELYMDLLDLVQDDIAQDLKKLYWPICQVLSKHKVSYEDTKAKMEVAWMALYLACKVYEGVVKGSNQLCGIDTSSFYEAIDPRDTFGAWEKACNVVCQYDNATCEDISKDHNVNLAFDIILNKLCDTDYVDSRCRKVLDMHPEHNERRLELEAQMQEDKIRDAAQGVLERSTWRNSVVKSFKVKG